MQRWAVTYKVHVWMSSSLIIIRLRFRCSEVGERVSVGSNNDCREHEHAQDKADTHSQQPTSLATEHLKQSKDRRSSLRGSRNVSDRRVGRAQGVGLALFQ